MANFNKTIKQLQKAIKEVHGIVLVCNRTQWYSTTEGYTINEYSIKKAVVNDPDKRPTYEEIFRSGSIIQECLFLRDYWYWLNGWAIPVDNEIWNEKRKKFYNNEMYASLLGGGING